MCWMNFGSFLSFEAFLVILIFFLDTSTHKLLCISFLLFISFKPIQISHQLRIILHLLIQKYLLEIKFVSSVKFSEKAFHFYKTSINSEFQQNYLQQQSFMNKTRPTIILLIFLLSFTFQASVPNDYIWINYQKRYPVKVATDNTYNIAIPCQAKFDKCRIKFTQLPLGWTVADDKTLLIPKQDITKPGAFVVRGTFTGLLGDKIDADMVVELKPEYFIVSDRKKFLQKYGYNEKNSNTQQLQINRSILDYNKYMLDGFPTVDQVSNLIKNQGVYEVLKYVNDLAAKQAPCQKKVGYLNQVYKALLKKIIENDAIIQISAAEIEAIRKNITDLQQKKRNQQNKQYNDKIYMQLKGNIKKLTQARDTASNNLNKNQFLATSYYNNMKVLSLGSNKKSDNKTKQQIQITQIEDQMKQLEDIIAKAMEKKKKLEQNLKVKKAFAGAAQAAKPNITQPKNQQNQSKLLDLYQSKYREYSELALTSKLQILDLDQQIKSQTVKLSSKNSQVQKIEQQMDQLKKTLRQKTSPSSTQLQEQLKNINQIFIIGADNFKNKINKLNTTTCN